MNDFESRPWFDHYDDFAPYDVDCWDAPLYSLLDNSARDYPDRLAIIFQNTRIRYDELKHKAECLAGALVSLGVKPGQRVAIMLPNLPQAVIAFWGVLKAGGVVVMTNPLYMEKELLTNLQDSNAEHIIILDKLWPRINALRNRLPLKNIIVTTVADALSFPLNLLYRFKEGRESRIDIPQDGAGIFAWKKLLKKASPHSEPIADPQKTPALLQYTGGTTGIPKGVILTHANLGTNCKQVLSVINVTPKDRHTFVSLLPFFHVYGITLCLTIPAFLASVSLVVPRYAPQEVLKLIEKHKATVFPGTPSVYMTLLQQKDLSKYDLKSLQICVSGSAPLPREIFRKFQAVTGAAILEGYGLSEASPITHINPLGRQGQRANSIGLPIPGTDSRIVDMNDGRTQLPPGKMGEMIIKGPQVMRGYWNQPEETVSTLRDGWLYTGDLAKMDEDGYFYILDRKKDMVLVGGYNVYPREIDEVLLEHPKILEAASVGIPDGIRGEKLKAVVVPQQGVELTKAEIVAWCRERLASYKIPRSIEFRDSLPKTIVGKVLRRALREQELQKTDQTT